MAATEILGLDAKPSAAVLIQKTYRGYRARRKLADAAIMSKPVGWWNVVDSVVLQHNSLQYYAHSKSWKANDNWKRLKRKASKVGKGLEKNGKALKLALQHWLEAVDARHRYGHNLRPYYLYWHDLETQEPFFWWLDLGSGRQVELPKCSRATLHEQQITYLSPDQRKHYEVAIYHGKLYYQSSGELVHTPNADRWIFVMSPSYKLYIGKKKKGKFQHSSFLAGGATTAAGRLVVTHGVLKLMEAHSGHYRPSPENFEALVGILVTRGADLHLAKVQLVSDDLLEKQKAKELAGKVRHAIEGTCGEGQVEVKVEDQRLVSVDSGHMDGQTDYLITNLTFSGLQANKKRAAEESLAVAQVNQPEQDKPIVPNDDVPVQKQDPVVVEEKLITRKDEEQEEAIVEPKPAQNEEEDQPVDKEEEDRPVDKEEEKKLLLVHQEVAIILKKKPSELVLPVATLLEHEAGVGPKTATLPTSPAFSRNSHLAHLGLQQRRETLKKYGPRKIAFGTNPGLEPVPQTC